MFYYNKAENFKENCVTLPNWITIGRLFCIPFVLYYILQNYPQKALIFFLIAAISDALDGFLARYMKAGSTLGAYLDPLADKLLFFSTFVVLGYLGIIPSWLVSISVGRDILILGGFLLLRYDKVNIKINPTVISKLNTVVQSILILTFLCI